MNSDDSELLFETYKLHAELAERVAAVREGLNKLYSGMVTSIVVASVLLYRLVPESESETILVLPALGIIVSLSWILALHSMTGRLVAKHDILVVLEQKLPFNFLKQENALFDKGGFLRRKYTGLIMPCVFLAIFVIWLVFLLAQEFCSS